MRNRFISFVLLLLTTLFLSSCMILPFGNRGGYHPQHHNKKRTTDCGCEVITKLPKTFYIA